MADNYLEFSASLDLKCDEERRWLHEQLEEVERDDGDIPRFLIDYPELENCCGAGFEVSWNEESVFFFAEDSGDVGSLVHLVKKFLRKFRPNDTWYVTWAESCSKPRIDAFGGGAVFVTASDERWMCTHDFVEEQLAAFRAGSSESSAGNGMS